MIAIYAEKPDMGTKIAAALFGIPLENGVVVTFSQLEKYERQIKACLLYTSFVQVHLNRISAI